MAAPTHFVTLARARELPGLRLVIGNPASSPGLWGLAARAIIELKKIPYTPVSDKGGVPPASELADWTGQTSLPVAMYEAERPRSRWTEIIQLAERLGPIPQLVPEPEADRAAMFGICSELCDEDGFGWCFRLFVFNELEARSAHGRISELKAKYPVFRDFPSAKGRLIAIMEHLDDVLQSQKTKGSRYLIGESITAADIYWTAFASGFAPLLLSRLPLVGAMSSIMASDLAKLSQYLTIRHIAHLTYISEKYFPSTLALAAGR